MRGDKRNVASVGWRSQTLGTFRKPTQDACLGWLRYKGCEKVDLLGGLHLAGITRVKWSPSAKNYLNTRDYTAGPMNMTIHISSLIFLNQEFQTCHHTPPALLGELSATNDFIPGEGTHPLARLHTQQPLQSVSQQKIPFLKQ